MENGGSLAQQAHERLKEEIIGLRRPPGQRLVERELAEELGVSRIPLREALRQLEAEGLVVIVPRQGAMVAPFTAADVLHLLEVRESLETLAARLAATRVGEAGPGTGDGIAAARVALAAARAAMTADDARAVAEANASFHALVVQLAGNPLLASMMQPLAARVRWLFHLSHASGITLQMCQEHEAILEAIAVGDADRAGDLSARHVRATREPTLAMAALWASDDLDPVQVTRTRQREPRAGRA